ncbi:PREDICTED: intraflagellar transport protein 43 homolog A-like isoform X2 [Priapulus caudatus]|uniref:Intraflagellar transport protein 43 homolog A-like isoform X2 n=1 Tax=Priapulus caudatus TaxID=37621 RepID=A0ABM1EN22_PRICU|nr:PREDICTED: intraflagellar transport protein 43 homolog A-like isoform X2 [Priapulus caudatus]
MDEDDLDFMPHSQVQNQTREARQGRRAGDRPGTGAAAAGAVNGALMNGDIPTRPTRRTAGWSESQRKKGAAEPEDERLRASSPLKDDESDEIPVIPDLDEVNEEDMANQVAQAPSVTVNRVATYRELDHDLLKNAAFLTLDNEVDLKLLTKCLQPEFEVVEEDKPWEWERLFTEVSSELNLEWDRAQNYNNDEVE